MASIKGWEIDSSRSKSYIDESGKEIIIKHDGRELALIRDVNNLIVVEVNGVNVIIDEDKKRIALTSR